MFVGQDTTTKNNAVTSIWSALAQSHRYISSDTSLKDGKTQPSCMIFCVTDADIYTMSSKQIKIKLHKIMNWFKRELVHQERVPLIGSTVNVSTNQDSRNYWVSTTFQSPASCFEISRGMVLCLLEPLKEKAEKPLDILPNFLVTIRHENKCFCFPKCLIPKSITFTVRNWFFFSFLKNSAFIKYSHRDSQVLV